MRYSKQRELILQTVQALSDHPTAEEIHTQAAPRCPGLSLGTVYRNLNSLVDMGRVRRSPSRPGRPLCPYAVLAQSSLLHSVRQRGGCTGG